MELHLLFLVVLMDLVINVRAFLHVRRPTSPHGPVR